MEHTPLIKALHNERQRKWGKVAEWKALRIGNTDGKLRRKWPRLWRRSSSPLRLVFCACFSLFNLAPVWGNVQEEMGIVLSVVWRAVLCGQGRGEGMKSGGGVTPGAPWRGGEGVECLEGVCRGMCRSLGCSWAVLGAFVCACVCWRGRMACVWGTWYNGPNDDFFLFYPPLWRFCVFC